MSKISIGKKMNHGDDAPAARAIDYTDLFRKKDTWPKHIAVGAVLGLAVEFSFYRAWNPVPVILTAAGWWAFHLFTDREDRKKSLKDQFVNFLSCLEGSLAAGYSLENALPVCRHDLGNMIGQNTDMCLELKAMENGLRAHHRVGEMFEDLAERSGQEDIILFAELLDLSTRSGGNLIRLVRDTSWRLRAERELELEVKSVISEQLLEYRLMCLIPILIMVYMQFCAYSFVAVLYEELWGRLFMTAFLAIYAAAAYWGYGMCKIGKEKS